MGTKVRNPKFHDIFPFRETYIILRKVSSNYFNEMSEISQIFREGKKIIFVKKDLLIIA